MQTNDSSNSDTTSDSKPKSEPYLSLFNPNVIPYQARVIRDIRKKFDYKLGTHEVLLSGSVGSAKSELMAHIVVTHCLMYPGAIACLGRKTMPDLKDTIYSKILSHISEDLVEGKHYESNQTRASIQFFNGSKIISRSWADKKYMKSRSLEISLLCIEELVETEEVDAYEELFMRVGRIQNVPEALVICATNPGSPTDNWYKRFFIEKKDTRHVYFSNTKDNPFLPKSYIRTLEENLDPKLARRMLYGEWLDLRTDVIYHQYSEETHYKREKYKVQSNTPVHLSFDFNIGEGKPMSAVFFQYSHDTFHFYDECIVQGADTALLMEEMAARGLFDENNIYVVHGDATGKSRSSKSLKSDYQIIKEFFEKYRNKRGMKVQVTYEVPTENPPIRTRHNVVNTYMRNSSGRVRLFVYQDAKTLNEGFRLTKLKPGGKYIEDDSKFFQHCTTAAGYGIVASIRRQTDTFKELDRWKIWQF